MGGADGLEEFYEATYFRLVAVVGTVHGDPAEAEEAVQEAFIRLMGRWSSVSAYDDPEAWVRHVALRLCSNGRRKLRNRRRAYAALDARAVVPGPDAAAVDVERALAGLPTDQRAVVVLRGTGLSTAETAVALGIPEGTVKSRLSRARAHLKAALEGAADARA